MMQGHVRSTATRHVHDACVPLTEFRYYIQLLRHLMHFTYELSRSLYNMAILSENLATFNARALCPGYNINAFNILSFHTIIIWNYDAITVAATHLFTRYAYLYDNAPLVQQRWIKVPFVCARTCACVSIVVCYINQNALLTFNNLASGIPCVINAR